MDTLEMRHLIERKRDGGRIKPDEWHAVVREFMREGIDEAQMAALAMACVFRGLDLDETVALTAAMIESGRQIDLGLDDFVVDKHSSGGVGDTVSLIVVPLVAACGVRVAKVSGRALGHTGGTLDKFEAIEGVRTELEPAEFAAIVRDVGCAIAAQSASLVPADKRLYALRDRTGTVPDPGLIAASMVSKKIAAGADGIVYDVKCGNGAFMKDARSARALAALLVEVTVKFGRRAAAVISDMSEPLGPAVGTALEVIEARDYLRGVRRDPRLDGLVRAVAGTMLGLAGRAPGATAGGLASDGPYERFVAMTIAQGGSRRALEALAPAPEKAEATSRDDGYVVRIDAVRIGEIARDLVREYGPRSGVRVAKRLGDRVARGEAFGFAIGGGTGAGRALAEAFSVGRRPSERHQLVAEAFSDSAERSTSAMR